MNEQINQLCQQISRTQQRVEPFIIYHSAPLHNPTVASSPSKSFSLISIPMHSNLQLLVPLPFKTHTQVHTHTHTQHRRMNHLTNINHHKTLVLPIHSIHDYDAVTVCQAQNTKLRIQREVSQTWSTLLHLGVCSQWQ